MIISLFLTQVRSEKIQLGVEHENLLPVQMMMCCGDSLHVTLTMLRVHWIWSPRSLWARTIY